jgi:pre-rRNA-processing protein TSR4
VTGFVVVVLLYPPSSTQTFSGVDQSKLEILFSSPELMIQLGFCVPVTEDSPPLGHTSADWSQWDGGQVGGRISWLEPCHIPPAPLYCICDCQDCPCYQNRMTHAEEEPPLDTTGTAPTTKSAAAKSRPTLLHFMGQLYAPEKGERFHRTLYLFCCPRCSHVECHLRIRVLRTQLPRINPYWPEVAAPESPRSPECVVCRFPAVGQCPVTQQRFCTRDHQRRYQRWPEDDKAEQAGIYAVLELVVEEEPPVPLVVEVEEEEHPVVHTLFPSTKAEDSDEEDDDERLEQDDLNAITGGGGGAGTHPSRRPVDAALEKKNQAVFTKFTRRMTERPHCRDQVLRYNCAWPDDSADHDDDEDRAPLWMRADHRPATIPPCPLCGTARQFEFQLLPQLLSHLTPTARTIPPAPTDPAVLAALRQTETVLAHTPPGHIPPALVEQQQRLVAGRRRQLQQSRGDRPADWGVVVVYTCPRGACEREDDHAYAEEFVWVQPPMDAQDWEE